MAPSAPRDNEGLARAICERGELDGRRYEPGTFVAIAEGRVIGVGRSFEEADAHLVRLGTTTGEEVICEVATPVVDVVRCEPTSCR